MGLTDYLMNADDVSKEFGISKGFAYKIIRELNQELQKEGYLTISGKIPKAYLQTRFYGCNTETIVDKQ